MRHPTEGVLRRLLDEPAGVADPDRAHVADCPVCLAGLAAARTDADTVGAALRPADADVADVDRGWAGLSRTLAADSPARPAAPARSAAPARAPRLRAALRRPAVAALAAALALTGAGVAAANDWLPIFRTEQVAPVGLQATDLVSVPDLSAFGALEVTEPEHASVPDAAAAAERTGLDVPSVGTLPPGVTGDPTYQVVGPVEGTFTVDLTRAADAVDGELPPAPPGLDGSRFRIEAGPGAAAVWSRAEGVPTMIVAQAVAPTIFSDGVPFETARDYFLSLPGLPADLVEQLRAVSADGSTLPLPVPEGLVDTESAKVDGAPATVLSSRDGLLGGVVWVEDGVVTVVAGSIGTEEALAVARGPR